MGIPSRESNTSAMTNFSAQSEFCLFRPNRGRLGVGSPAYPVPRRRGNRELILTR